MSWQKYITGPGFVHQRAFVHGTEIPIASVLTGLAHGVSTESLIRTYPGLTAEAIQDALAYAARLVDDKYGSAAATYQGHGRVKLTDESERPCTFEALQLRDGSVFLFLNLEFASFNLYDGIPLVDVVGSTTDGWNLLATGPSYVAYRPLWSEYPLAYRVDTLLVAAAHEETAEHSIFRVVNLILEDMDVPVEHPAGRAYVRRAPEYQRAVHLLKINRGIDVTAELVVEAHYASTCHVVAEDVCTLLSIARGTKVNWITREDYAESGMLVRRFHCSRVTKRYCALRVIDHSDAEDTRHFLETAIPEHSERKKQWGLSEGLVDAYLDAKSDVDYVQSRGVKLAVVMEMVKEAYLSTPGARRFVKNESEFGRIQKGLKAFLDEKSQEFGLEKEDRGYIKSNLKGLNHIPFKRVLSELCSKLELEVPEEDIKLFVRCRDHLVHTGRFYCESSKAEEAQDQRHLAPIEEYFWVLHFIDRMLLRIVGYRGPYIDWSNPGVPRKAEL